MYKYNSTYMRIEFYYTIQVLVLHLMMCVCVCRSLDLRALPGTRTGIVYACMCVGEAAPTAPILVLLVHVLEYISTSYIVLTLYVRVLCIAYWSMDIVHVPVPSVPAPVVRTVRYQ